MNGEYFNLLSGPGFFILQISFLSSDFINVTDLLDFETFMKRAELGLLEVLGLLVRMPGEGDVTALPCFVGS